jgi:hypothetical protein
MEIINNVVSPPFKLLTLKMIADVFLDVISLPLPTPSQFFCMRTDSISINCEKVGGEAGNKIIFKVGVVFEFCGKPLDPNQIASVNVGIVSASGEQICGKWIIVISRFDE